VTASTRAFLITGLIALPVAALLHLLSLLGLNAAWPAMVHLTLFGWVTAMIVAVNYHTIPVFAARDFPSARLLWAHWASFSAGVALAAAGLLIQSQFGIVGGLLLQLIAAAIFTANIILLFQRGTPRPHRPPVPPIPDQTRVDRVGTQATRSAGLALPAALLLLLANRLGWVSGAWVLPAEHLATLGWIMLMIVGVAYHVLPRFTGHGTRGPAWARLQVGCQIGALALIVPALGLGWQRVFAAGGLLMAIAIGLFAWNVWPALQVIRHTSGSVVRIAQEQGR
jgi:hypothetical protein